MNNIMATKKETVKKETVKKAPKAKEVITYRHWNGEGYETRTK